LGKHDTKSTKPTTLTEEALTSDQAEHTKNFLQIVLVLMRRSRKPRNELTPHTIFPPRHKLFSETSKNLAKRI